MLNRKDSSSASRVRLESSSRWTGSTWSFLFLRCWSMTTNESSRFLSLRSSTNDLPRLVCQLQKVVAGRPNVTCAVRFSLSSKMGEISSIDNSFVWKKIRSFFHFSFDFLFTFLVHSSLSIRQRRSKDSFFSFDAYFYSNSSSSRSIQSDLLDSFVVKPSNFLFVGDPRMRRSFVDWCRWVESFVVFGNWLVSSLSSTIEITVDQTRSTLRNTSSSDESDFTWILFRRFQWRSRQPNVTKQWERFDSATINDKPKPWSIWSFRSHWLCRFRSNLPLAKNFITTINVILLSLRLLPPTREQEPRQIIVIPTETMFSLSVDACLSECPSTLPYWWSSIAHRASSDEQVHLGHSFFVFNIIDDLLLDRRWFNEHVKTMKTTLGTANYEYFFDSFFILANRRLSSILVLVALSVSVRPLTCARIRSLGNDLHLSPTMNQQWKSSFTTIDQPCHLIEQKLRILQQNEMSRSKFNRRYVWIVRSSRWNRSTE